MWNKDKETQKVEQKCHNYLTGVTEDDKKQWVKQYLRNNGRLLS